MYSSCPSGYDRKRDEIFLIMAKWGVRVPQNHFFLLFFSCKATNKITGDKPSQQLFLKAVATQLPLLY